MAAVGAAACLVALAACGAGPGVVETPLASPSQAATVESGSVTPSASETTPSASPTKAAATPTKAAAAPAPTKNAVASPKPTKTATVAKTDPDMGTCKAAKAAGYGPYYEGKDPEYDWYRDADHDGIVCE